MTTATLAHQPSAHAGRADRAVQLWLASVATLVFTMIVVGGATRLTDSGLSITEWQPLLGAVPPLTDADWQIAFTKYQAIPQYASVNRGMSLAEFKGIFWWEWGHRFLGRFIGLAFALPLAAFAMAGAIKRGYLRAMLGVLALGGLQGAIGWYMVKSGLADRIDVSPYRLALHLSVAFTLLGALVWLALDVSKRRHAMRLAGAGPQSRADRSDAIRARVLLALVFAQVALGGFVAGLKAGRAFNTWPLMDGHIVPEGYWRLEPWWLNFTENMASVQFNHRLIAYIVVALGVAHALKLRRDGVDPAVWRGGALLASLLLAQMALGIVTVLAAVPIGLGIAHQGLAAIVFAVAVGHVHAMRPVLARDMQ